MYRKAKTWLRRFDSTDQVKKATSSASARGFMKIQMGVKMGDIVKNEEAKVG